MELSTHFYIIPKYFSPPYVQQGLQKPKCIERIVFNKNVYHQGIKQSELKKRWVSKLYEISWEIYYYWRCSGSMNESCNLTK